MLRKIPDKSYCSYFSYVEHEMWGLERRWKGVISQKKKKKKSHIALLASIIKILFFNN